MSHSYIQVTALTPASAGYVLWRTGGRHWVTVVLKATFELVHGQAMRLCAPFELVKHDGLRPGSGCLDEAAETAPYLPGAGVILTGSAYPPGGQPAVSAAVRLAVVREKPLLDKTLHVYGDRIPQVATAQPFHSMPLVYERAYGGSAIPENPAGVGTPGSAALPNVISPADPRRPAGFGPIARHWPSRARLLGSFDARALTAGDLTIPEGFEWRYFHAAPPDQQIDKLCGDEWIVLDGMHPRMPRIQTQLPSVAAKALRYVATSRGIGSAQPFPMTLDTLIIEARHMRCSAVWRGRIDIDLADAPEVRVFAGVEIGGRPLVWPSPEYVAQSVLRAASVAPSVAATLDGTSDLDLSQVLSTILPFAPGEPAAQKQAPKDAPPAATTDMDLSQVLSTILPFGAAEPVRPSPLPIEPAPAAPAPAAPAPKDARTLVIEHLRAGTPVRDIGLAGADLHDLDLRRANLAGLDLTGANLAGADLRGANLQGATCDHASFARANLEGANLQRLSGAGADFRGAGLAGCDMRRAHLRDAKLPSGE